MSAPTVERPRAAGPSPTPDSHDFPTRRYDLVKEFVIALAVMAVLAAGLAVAFSSPDEKAMSLRDWADAAPSDVVATATAELAGTSASATYGPPYNSNGDGQTLGPLPLQKWGGVRIPVDSAQDLVVTPLHQVSGDAALAPALARWDAAPAEQRTAWASAYADALAKAPNGDPAGVPASAGYGPVPVMTQSFLDLARAGGLESVLGSPSFYGSDPTKALLLLSDGSHLEDQARARSLGGDQWGMMNETGNYPGQPWMWLYTFWYQVEPFASSDNADALVWGLMVVLTLLLALLPFIPGLRSIPRWIPVHRLIWRSWYRSQGAAATRR
jgi:hypothetical protein